MKKFTFLIVVLLLVLQSSVLAQRGSFALPPTLMYTLSPEQIMLSLQTNMEETAYKLTDLLTYKKYSVNAVKVIYNTIDGRGNATTASGVVFLPAVTATTYMPVLAYLHGTLTLDADAPSNLAGAETIIGWIMAMDGYISVLPDYLGMGAGPGIHPYLHAASEASASVDLLKAAMLLCNSDPRIMAKSNGNLYLCGYSQGGHAALATQNELQMYPVEGLTLRKTVAGSGAYSLSYVQKNYLFAQTTYPSPYFLPYMLLGYQEVYGNLYSSLNQIFVPPYNTEIPGLFDGLHSSSQINVVLPKAWKTMFVPNYLRNIQYNYFHPVNAALRKNDVINWKPRTDLHLYYCTCDEVVPNENSMLAYLSFVLKGSSKVTCLPVGPYTHNECAPFVLLLAKIQFDCASGVNPCGINLLSLLKSSANKDLSVFSRALLAADQSPDMEILMKNKMLAAYVQEPDKADDLLVYPNPAADIVNIQSTKGLSGNTRISMYDMQGRRVSDRIFDGTAVQIDVKPLPAGVYKIVMNGEANVTQTLVVFK